MCECVCVCVCVISLNTETKFSVKLHPVSLQYTQNPKKIFSLSVKFLVL